MTDTNETDPAAERIAESVREQLADDDSSRRSFLSRSAIAGGALLALGGGAGLTVAEEHEDEEEGDEMEAGFDDVAGTDLDVLNYALTLEQLESAFYMQAMEMFSEDDFMQAEALQGYSEEMRQVIYTHVVEAGEQEAAHVEVLTQAVELLGGEPAQAASYDFPMEGVDEFLTNAQVIENTGVAAYAGAAPYIESPDLLKAALAIHSVEARHAALFNVLNGVPPFPTAFDEPKSQQEVLDQVAPYIVEQADEAEDEEEEEEDEDEDEDEETETDEAGGTGNETAGGTGNETAGGTGNETAGGTGNETTTDASG